MTSTNQKREVDEIELGDYWGARIGPWEQGVALFVRRGDGQGDVERALDLEALLRLVAREHTAVLLEARDGLVREKLIEKVLNLVPGDDTGSVSFRFPVTAYTKGFGNG